MSRSPISSCARLGTRICLAFDVDRSFELPDNVVLTELNHELRDADLLVCFGGDGTILHASKAATKAGIPVLGVNIGTMGFMPRSCASLRMTISPSSRA